MVISKFTTSLQTRLARFNTSKKGTPRYISRKKASYTVEAAVVMPLVLAVMIFVIFIFRILAVQYQVQQALDTSSRTVAICWEEKKEAEGIASAIALCYGKLAKDTLVTSYVDMGLLGLNFSESSAKDSCVDLRVSYSIRFPINFFGKIKFQVIQHSKNRKWIGFNPSENGVNDEQYVYVTEYGEVYHEDFGCSYLNPSISAVDYSKIEGARNIDGGKYYACLLCKASDVTKGTVYITDYGEAYHKSLSCGGLKRTIYKITRSKAKALYRPCHKCGAS